VRTTLQEWTTLLVILFLGPPLVAIALIGMLAVAGLMRIERMLPS